ncbi:hypothetical protein KK062_00150 [Fulvivirgaceae bacterium PWU5]|uniref:Uncharacterized protein n=1 Tax=Dawidia cretensis TaxID=2782350 RepID=A0AAP2DVB3_9BACT|nr:hypothetical protein [Dawidia cretensis]MBT1706607.1 hypothetical protein [Dawidia cretensis]
MKYYEIRMASDPAVTGLRDGGSQVEISRDGFVDKNQYDRLMSFIIGTNYWEKEDYNVDVIFNNIEYGVAERSAKLSDFICFRPHIVECPYIVSDLAKSVLERFQMGEHCFYPIKLYKNKVVQKERYYLLYTPILDFDIVDYPSTSFYTGHAILGTKKYIPIKSREDKLRNPLVWVEKGILTTTFDKTRDFFLSKVGGDFASEQLMEEILHQGLTGLNFPREKGAIFEYPE